jgi:hypothetical protein
MGNNVVLKVSNAPRGICGSERGGSRVGEPARGKMVARAVCRVSAYADVLARVLKWLVWLP